MYAKIEFIDKIELITMQKVDVAIQSYKKPESLIYTLFSLKKYCSGYIDTVYINDDCSGDKIIAKYLDTNFQKFISPLKIKVRVNEKPVGYSHTIFTKNMLLKNPKTIIIKPSLVIKNNFYTENDIRYEWAINSTDKEYLLIIHDDIKFLDNIIKFYLETIEKDKKIAIVGPLGQCWNCADSHKCSPDKILQGQYPHKYWPLTTNPKGLFPFRYKRMCRINEWCCLINVNIARNISKQKGCYFGNMEDKGDTGAYWFEQIVKLKYKFADPIPNKWSNNKYFIHCWQGHAGHSIWEDQGNGIQKYQKETIEKALKEEFNYEFND